MRQRTLCLRPAIPVSGAAKALQWIDWIPNWKRSVAKTMRDGPPGSRKKRRSLDCSPPYLAEVGRRAVVTVAITTIITRKALPETYHLIRLCVNCGRMLITLGLGFRF